MKKSIKKRSIAVSALVLVLAAAIYVNWQFSGDKGGLSFTSSKKVNDAQYVNASAATSSMTDRQKYLLNAKQDRDNARNDAIAQLTAIEKDVDSDASAKKQAGEKRVALAESISKEASIETLLTAKGYKGAVAVIGNDDITVIVPSEDLKTEDTVQIMDTVQSQTDIIAEKIKIMNI